MYVSKAYVVKGYVLIKSYSKRTYRVPFRKRAEKIKETPRAMERYNNQKRAEKIQLLILNNFDRGFHITLDYPKDGRPESYEEAEDNLKKVLYKVSRRLKRKGEQFKYLAVTERGKKAAALHHHLIIENKQEVLDELREVWGDHMKAFFMYPDGGYEDLAEYFIKMETKEEQTKGKSKYHRSRNLKEPVEKSAIRVGHIQMDPPVPEGYEIVHGTLKNGYNEMIGVRYQKYLLKRLPKDLIEVPQKPKITVNPPKGAQKRKKKQTLLGAIKKLFRRKR